eukprot:TRINITY_DN5761_c0_g1_i1.p1 TRINITY_DN5761_c0_g1~~TRINITY_DN5761_c0_g1_i1.p1  ORF type:complete len:285 (-),score=74.81 TRINITY_DN5761_c0_g1_i1:95-949(-)
MLSRSAPMNKNGWQHSNNNNGGESNQINATRVQEEKEDNERKSKGLKRSGSQRLKDMLVSKSPKRKDSNNFRKNLEQEESRHQEKLKATSSESLDDIPLSSSVDSVEDIPSDASSISPPKFGSSFESSPPFSSPPKPQPNTFQSNSSTWGASTPTTPTQTTQSPGQTAQSSSSGRWVATSPSQKTSTNNSSHYASMPKNTSEHSHNFLIGKNLSTSCNNTNKDNNNNHNNHNNETKKEAAKEETIYGSLGAGNWEELDRRMRMKESAKLQDLTVSQAADDGWFV